jgi:hypothetical protein
MIRRMAELHREGVLTEAEFQAKKTECWAGSKGSAWPACSLTQARKSASPVAAGRARIAGRS